MQQRREIADGVVEIVLVGADTATLPDWSPGAHVDVELGPNLVRQYSLCGDPSDATQWTIAVLAAENSRGGSRAVHGLRPGAVVDVAAPRNNFELVDAPHYQFVVGGIGITALLPMIRAVAASKASCEVHYGAGRRGSMAYLDEVVGLGGVVVSTYAQNEVGHLPVSSIVASAPSDAVIYGCGPEPMLQVLRDACAVRSDVSLRFERFSASAGESRHGRPFSVELARSKLRLRVGADESILEVLTRAGIFVPTSCQEGTCGSCETVVLDGTPDHRDSIMGPDDDDADGALMVCVSRALSDVLVLDV